MVSPPELPLAVVNPGQRWWVPGVSVSKLSSASGPEQCEQPEAHRCTGHGDAGTVLPARCLAGSGGESGDDIHAQPQSAMAGQERHAAGRMYGGSVPVPVVATPRFTPPVASRRLPEHATTATTRALP